MGLIKLQKVTKKYDDKIILNNIEKEFPTGGSIAFVGHNGCGKSTLLKLIAGLVKPTSGSVSYDKPLLFHYIPEKFPPVALTARNYLLRMGAVDGLTSSETKGRIERLGEEFFLDGLLDSPMRALSKGTLQKVGVIQALLRQPDVLLLDEPLSGQDAESQKVFIEKVNRLREQDVTVFMACHEKKLLNAIAEEAYAIEDGVLEDYKQEEIRVYSLLLENDGDLRPTENMTKYGRYYKLEAEEALCDRILPGLLETGWKLRAMNTDGSGDEKNS